MKRFLAAVLMFAAVISALGFFFFEHVNSDREEEKRAEYIIALNEIEQLSNRGEQDAAEQKAAELRNLISMENNRKKDYYPLVMSGICIVFLAGMSFYFYRAMIRPFHKLSDFAEKIAGGELDIPLKYEKTSYFGKFTWAFDRMRKEIKRARMSEKEAYENNKTVIASLSHDIKTPVASVRAYAEGLEAGMASTPEKQAKYLEVIMRKCDEITKYTNDLLLHSLSDLEKLRVEPERTNAAELIKKTVREISAGNDDICFEYNGPDIFVMADRMRTSQLIENLINNAVKYAKTEILVTLNQSGDYAEIHVRDFGPGISDEDIPFVRNKFFRGHNCGNEQGSGLGLYIAEYIAVQSGGELRLNNLTDGFEAVFVLPVVP